MSSIYQKLTNFFLNDRIIIGTVIFNAIVIFLQESGVSHVALEFLDMACTFVFLVEMLVKISHFGLRKYCGSAMNCMDAILVLISLPSALNFFIDLNFLDFSVFLVLRIFRVFRFFRLIRLFPNFSVILSNFRLAMRQSYGVMLGFLIIIITFALLGSCMFRDAAPQYFDTPLNAIYTTFRMFTIEGWYDVPDAVAQGMDSPILFHLVRLYFCFLLLTGGIIGMSLINSIFVDAMVSDNNDDVKEQLRRMEEKLNRLLAEREGRALPDDATNTDGAKATDGATDGSDANG